MLSKIQPIDIQRAAAGLACALAGDTQGQEWAVLDAYIDGRLAEMNLVVDHLLAPQPDEPEEVRRALSSVAMLRRMATMMAVYESQGGFPDPTTTLFGPEPPAQAE